MESTLPLEIAPCPVAIPPVSEYTEKIETPTGSVSVVSGRQLINMPHWVQCFAHQRKDHRCYGIIERTLADGFEYRYFVLQDCDGCVRAIQPFFIVHQDLLVGLGAKMQSVVERLRSYFPNLFKTRILMVGCTAGEGHLSADSDEEAHWIARTLHDALYAHARRLNVSLVVLKEFPSSYRQSLNYFSGNGYTRLPSMPMVRLDIGFATFEEFMAKVLSGATRKNLRRKFRKAAKTAPIEMQVVDDVTPFVDEVYPLYLQVFHRAKMRFEKLTKAYLCELGQMMPDKARFFIWRQNGKVVAFSVCMVQGQAIYDEYIGLDYPLALDLHLFFYTLRDIIQWAMNHGLKTYYSASTSYDPKLHLRCDLVPLDIYVSHTSWLPNLLLRWMLPLIGPTRRIPTLRQFANACEL